MHEHSFADVVGKKPVALLFATPQLCQSRVCGPVVDVGLQLKSTFGDKVEFIHQEVYEGNDPKKGLREPLKRFNLATEPWLFVVGKDGRITARLEPEVREHEPRDRCGQEQADLELRPPEEERREPATDGRWWSGECGGCCAHWKTLRAGCIARPSALGS